MKGGVYLCMCVCVHVMSAARPVTHLWSCTDIYIYEIWYSPWKKQLIHHSSSSCVINFVIGLFLGTSLTDMSTFKEPKFFPRCRSPPPQFPPFSQQRSVKWSRRSIPPDMAHFEGSEQRCNFSGSDEHLLPRSECIQACSHFVKRSIRLGRRQAVIALDVVKTHSDWQKKCSAQDKMAELKYWILMPPYVGREHRQQAERASHSGSVRWVSAAWIRSEPLSLHKRYSFY